MAKITKRMGRHCMTQADWAAYRDALTITPAVENSNATTLSDSIVTTWSSDGLQLTHTLSTFKGCILLNTLDMYTKGVLMHTVFIEKD